MIIYFDESYDRKRRYLLLGALFLPHTRSANRQMGIIKEKYRHSAPGHRFVDVKYSKSGDRFVSAVCKEIIDLFARGTAYFRCVVVDTESRDFSWDHFGGGRDPGPLVKARAYNRFAELLLRRNLEPVHNAVLLADRLCRTEGDDFAKDIAVRFGPTINPSTLAPVPPQIRAVHSIDTGLEQYKLGQMCDILLGLVLGNMEPPMNSNKLGLIQYAKEVLAIPSFGPDYWCTVQEMQGVRQIFAEGCRAEIG